MGWCEHCHNTGELDCHCGGDLCVCENYGTYPCPYCDGDRDDDEMEYWPPEEEPADHA